MVPRMVAGWEAAVAESVVPPIIVVVATVAVPEFKDVPKLVCDYPRVRALRRDKVEIDEAHEPARGRDDVWGV